MKVAAFLLSYHAPIGSVMMTRDLLEGLSEAGHDVTVFVDRGEPPAPAPGVTLLPRHRWDRTERFDVVVGHVGHGSIGYMAAALARGKYVRLVHNTSPGLTYWLGRYPAALTVWNAYSTREAHHGTGGLIVRSPLRVVQHAADRRRADAVTLVNLCPPKGSEVFHALAERMPGVPFLGVRGGYGILDARPGANRVELVGPTRDMPRDVWSRTRVLLAPSISESWGRAMVEALCSGIPVIAHPTPGLVEALGPAGIYVDRDDVDTWEGELEALLDNEDVYTDRSRLALTRAHELEKLTADDRAAFIEAVSRLHAL